MLPRIGGALVERSRNERGRTTSAGTGLARFALTAGTVGAHLYRARVIGDSRGADGLSANLTVTVR